MKKCLLCAASLAAVAYRPSPVPYSRSGTDGMPTERDWDLFTSLYQQVLNSSTMKKQREDLLKYAADQVKSSLSEISHNLETLKVKGFDLVWPGDAYNGVAYGGLYEVLARLEEAGVSQVGKRMGVSGGAASTILTMADGDSFLKFYQVYQLYFQGHPQRIAQEAWRDTGVTSAIYAEAARGSAVFALAQRDALIVSKCSRSGNTIFRGFKTLKQLVAAGYSSGDASIGGESIGTIVDDTDVGHCCDGGSVTVFPADVASIGFGLLLYNTPFVSSSKPTSDSIDRLFRSGVDTAIAALKSSVLSATMKDGGSIIGALPGPSGVVSADQYSAKIGKIVQTRDVDLAELVNSSLLLM